MSSVGGRYINDSNAVKVYAKEMTEFGENGDITYNNL